MHLIILLAISRGMNLEVEIYTNSYLKRAKNEIDTPIEKKMRSGYYLIGKNR